MVEVLKQGRNSPLTVEHQVLIIYAVTHGYLKEVPLELVSEFEKELFEFADETHPEIIASIKETKDLTKENEEALKEMLSAFVQKFLSAR